MVLAAGKTGAQLEGGCGRTEVAEMHGISVGRKERGIFHSALLTFSFSVRLEYISSYAYLKNQKIGSY